MTLLGTQRNEQTTFAFCKQRRINFDTVMLFLSMSIVNCTDILLASSLFGPGLRGRKSYQRPRSSSSSSCSSSSSSTWFLPKALR